MLDPSQTPSKCPAYNISIKYRLPSLNLVILYPLKSALIYSAFKQMLKIIYLFNVKLLKKAHTSSHIKVKTCPYISFEVEC